MRKVTQLTKKVVDYLKKEREKINFCIIGEPTNPKIEMIKIGRRGSLTAKLKVFGTQGPSPILIFQIIQLML